QHHNVSVSGGTQKVKYFLTAGYYDQKGNIRNFNFDRFNVRSNIDAQVTRNLSISMDLAGRLEKRSAPALGVGKNEYLSIPMQAIRMHPYLPETYEGVPVASLVNPVGINPVASRDLSGSNQSKMSVFQSNFTIRWNLPWVKGLHLKAMLSYDHDYTYGKVFKNTFDVMNADVSNMKELGVNYQKDTFKGIAETSLSESMGRASRLTGQYSINYARTFGKHDVTGLFLLEHSQRNYNGFHVTGRDFDLTDIPELDHANSIGAGKGFGGNSSKQPRAGYVGRITYAYDSKYLVEFSGRYDGSYKFAREKRWDFFPAVSVGWRISQEDFFRENVSFIDHMKLRLSYGKLGSDANASAFNYLRYMDWASTSPMVVVGGVPQRALMTSSVASPNMIWEVATSYNAGIEATFLNGLLGVEFDYFYKIISDILRSQSGIMPPSMGGNYESRVNDGRVDSRGFELVLSHNSRIKEVNFGARLNLNWSRNRIIRIDESANIPDWYRQNGRRVGMKDGYIAEGLFQTEEEIANSAVVNTSTRPGDIKYKDLNGDGRITYDQDKTWIGRSNIPELMGGLNLTAEWKGLDVSVLFQGAAICDVALMGFYSGVGWDNTEFTRPFYGGGNSPVYLMENSWTTDNPTAKYPRLTTVSGNNNAFSNTIWIINGSYLRLKNAQIGYTLPRSVSNYIGAQRLRFYLAGTNLLTWSHNPYLDPEAPDVNNGYYPQQRTFTFGVNVTF
ncbi:MAG: SusC/RagA family TonB-linked outer membrane protein, partial [Bacteroides sp.]|nr:SusC/RagA family TonB-linked outer membrane protein [Bacteroides sp.]